MKVKIRAFLTMKEAIGGQSSLELDLENGTILSLLEDLGNQFGEIFIKQVFETGGRDLGGQVLVLVNGRNYSNLPEGIHTPLEDGDEVAIFPPIAGGQYPHMSSRAETVPSLNRRREGSLHV